MYSTPVHKNFFLNFQKKQAFWHINKCKKRCFAQIPILQGSRRAEIRQKMEYAVKGGTFDSVFYFEWSLSYSSIVPRREDSKRRTLTLNLQLASKWERKAAANGFPTASSTPNFQQKHPKTDIPHYIEGAPQNVRTGGGYAPHREWLSTKVKVQLKTSETAENIGKHLKSTWEQLRTNHR